MRPLLRDLTLASLSLILTLLALELGLRAAGPRFEASFYIPDAKRYFVFRPNTAGWSTAEGEAWIRINSAGYRDREHALSKPPGTLRIAMLGDSTMVGLGLRFEDTIPAVLERSLPRSEVLNFAGQGYNIEAQFVTMQEDVWRYHPDILIATFSPYNTSLMSIRATNLSGFPYPYFHYEGDRLVPDPTPTTVHPSALHNLAQDLNNMSQLALLVRNVRGQFNAWRKVQSAPRTDYDYAAAVPPRDPATQEAWRITEGTLLLMRDEAARHNAEFWIVTLDAPIQVDPDASKRAVFLHRAGTNDLFYPEHRIREFADRNSIHCLTLAPQLAEYAYRTGQYLHGFPKTEPGTGHMNERGHHLAAQLIAEGLRTRGDSRVFQPAVR
jgi:hypothetical protein